jgi:mannan endo-1,4-beta-mannosidase
MKFNKITILLSILLIIFINPCAFGLEIGLATMNKEGHIPVVSEIDAFEAKVGRKIDTINWFMGINGDKGELPALPLKEMNESFKSKGIIPMLTLEPWGEIKDKQGKPKSPLDVINNGSLDDYFKHMAQDLKSYGVLVRFRFGHEMIQNDVPESNDLHPGWYPWQDTPKQYVEAFRRIHKIFKEEGAANVEFVWSPNYHTQDSAILAKYYPGQTYVDWIGLDGYNWAGGDFNSIFKPIYKALTQTQEDLFGAKPIMISEMAMAESLDVKKRTKSAWILDTFTRLKNEYPRVKSIYWFNVNKEKDWRLDSSADAFETFKKMIEQRSPHAQMSKM